ncbi:shikimate dehydrogenase [Thermosynechococcaceae cyanobacterium BACA0444]|uniref:Shikimate dehydrogenase (NADP(+)) n=1 Tax=Pseudocalidococcus azoricus BACA0444 TaxID=2918990 RepID=A0AAE4FPH4_9CYAN|nr:shikimate dehydrogenase [Pseudocalidococcus azoricus]MDS3859344.1 shikimate dehydrogenase [Pseudocalidococcus azoricus BACA0444]
MPIRGTTQLLGVIGYPVKHSLSPVIHNAALESLELDYVYLPFPIAPGDLAAALPGMLAIGVQGFNITIPHKQGIIPFLKSVSPLVDQVGAVNTVKREAGAWIGTNTDVAGFLAPLQALNLNWSNQTGLLLGCGGAARAVVVACWQLGLAELIVSGRDLAKLQVFQASWQDILPPRFLKIIPWGAWAGELAAVALVVNSTPLGMAPEINQSPLTPADLDQLPAAAILYDLIYTPNPTQLLAWGQERGLKTIDGLEMLIQQGAAAFQWWLGQPAPVDVMRAQAWARLFPEKV